MRRILSLAVLVFATAAFTACTNPTAPTQDSSVCGVYSGSHTC